MLFPVLLYRVHPNGVWPLHGAAKLHKITTANDEGELAALLGDGQGWFVPKAEPVIDETSPPTRAELEHKAKELGLTFHHKTGNAKLLAMIEEALA